MSIRKAPATDNAGVILGVMGRSSGRGFDVANDQGQRVLSRIYNSSIDEPLGAGLVELADELMLRAVVVEAVGAEVEVCNLDEVDRDSVVVADGAFELEPLAAEEAGVAGAEDCRLSDAMLPLSVGALVDGAAIFGLADV